ADACARPLARVSSTIVAIIQWRMGQAPFRKSRPLPSSLPARRRIGRYESGLDCSPSLFQKRKEPDMTTRAELRASLRVRLEDPTPAPLWSDAVLHDFLREA